MAETCAWGVAKWRSADDVWLDHTVLRAEDLGWLAPARKVTMWAVKVPDTFLSALPKLEWLDVRGGSGSSVDWVLGCNRLRYLAVNQIRGVSDLSAISTLASLEFLRLYGLPRVTMLPDSSALGNLARVELGSMKGLAGIGPVLAAPALEELLLVGSVRLAERDPEDIRAKTSLRQFGWFAEDVPTRTWMPVLNAVGKPASSAVFPEDWFRGR